MQQNKCQRPSHNWFQFVSDWFKKWRKFHRPQQRSLEVKGTLQQFCQSTLASHFHSPILIYHQVFFCVVFYGLFHGLCYLPVLLSLVGPSPYGSSEASTEESPSSSKPDDDTDCKEAYFNPTLATSTGDLVNVGAHQQKFSPLSIEGKCISYVISFCHCKFSKSLVTLIQHSFSYCLIIVFQTYLHYL